MPAAGTKGQREGEQARSTLRARLERRRGEIETAMLTRTHAIADPAGAADATYAESLGRAVAAALDFGLQTLACDDAGDPQVPVELLAQARLAARNQIGLDTVLRRYFAGYSLLGFFLIEEAGRDGLMDGAELRRLLVTQTGIFDRLLAAVGEEHARESEALHSSSQRRWAERIERLLAGELVDTAEVPYDFDGWHLGVVAAGAGASERAHRLARALDLRPLVVGRDEGGSAWAWLGSAARPDPAAAARAAARQPGGSPLAIGEPAFGIDGWRLTHRQAATALPIAQRRGCGPVRYADVALLASVLRDDLLAASLRTLFLLPLDGERDGGVALRETLRAYFAVGRNLSSAATVLGVSRRTISNRLLKVEQKVGRPLHTALAELEIALALEQLESAQPSSRIGPRDRS